MKMKKCYLSGIIVAFFCPQGIIVAFLNKARQANAIVKIKTRAIVFSCFKLISPTPNKVEKKKIEQHKS